MENNTIILLKGETRVTRKQFEGFKKGETVFGENAEPVEVKRWSIDQKEEAKKELAAHRSIYQRGAELYYITEYALMYCVYDEDGAFIEGADYDLADEQ